MAVNDPVHTAPDSISKNLISELMDNIRLLAKHAVQTGQLPASIKVDELYKIRQKIEDKKEINDHEFKTLVMYYQTLERRLGPVTADTLRATERVKTNGQKIRSEAEMHLSTLWKRTYINIALILLFHLIHAAASVYAPSELNNFLKLQSSTNDSPLSSIMLGFVGVITTYLIPFLYGALGADAYLLRETTRKLHLRQFDPRQIPANLARFLLGTLSGGVVVLFISEQITSQAFPAAVFAVAGAAPGFLAGYSTDFLFETLERVISAFFPRSGRVKHKYAKDSQIVDDILREYRRKMDNATDPGEKDFLRALVEDLESKARLGI